MSSNVLNNQDINIVLCPMCRKKIPFCRIINDEGKVFAKIQCSCLDKEIICCDLEKYLQHLQRELNKSHINLCSNTIIHNTTITTTLKAEKYCENCNQWLCQQCLINHNQVNATHILKTKEIDIICKEHKKRFISYCYDCQYSLCIECEKSPTKNHSKHRKTQLHIQNLITLTETFNAFRLITDSNQTIKNQFDTIINSEINRLEKYKKDIQLCYDMNIKYNNKLKEFCQLLMNTVGYLSTYPNYALINLLSNFKVQPPLNNIITYPIKSIEECYETVKRHLKNSYAVAMQYEQCEIIHKFEGSLESIGTIPFSEKISTMIQLNDEQLITTSEHQGRIDLWNLETWKIEHSINLNLHNNKEKIFSFIQLNDDNRLSALSADDNTIRIWDIIGLICISTHRHHCNIYSMIQLNDNRLVTGGEDNTIQIWNITSSTFTINSLYILKGHNFYINSLCLLSDGNFASGDYKYVVKIWDKETLKCRMCLNENDCLSLMSLPILLLSLIQLNDGRIASCDNNNVKVWNIISGKCDMKLQGHCNYVYAIVQLGKGDERIVSGGYDKTIRIWDVMTGLCLNVLNEHNESIMKLVVLKDNRLISIANGNRSNFNFKMLKEQSCIKIWNL